MSISQLARSVNPSPTMKLNEEARALKAKGEPVIHLGTGEPKNPAPDTALMAVATKLEEGQLKYVPTGGMPSLKDAIIQYTEDNYGRTPAQQNVIVSSGAKHSVYNVLLAVVDPGDEVIQIAPYWVSYPEMVKMVGGVSVFVTPESDTFEPTIEEIEKAVTPKTKAIIVNSPNNPSGGVYTDDFVEAIVGLCEKRGIYLIMDDIYHKLAYGDALPAPGYRYTGKEIDDSMVIAINGISKIYGMTGARIGWTVASREVVSAIGKLQGQTTSCASVLSQVAAEGALRGGQEVVEALRVELRRNRDELVKGLQALPDLKINVPGGTFYCFPDFSAYNKDSSALAAFLLEKALVVTIPGGDFGMEGHLRLSYSGSLDDVQQGAARIVWALDPNSPAEIMAGDRKLVRDWL
jgi:aspartate aminotransferase